MKTTLRKADVEDTKKLQDWQYRCGNHTLLKIMNGKDILS